MYVLLLWDAWVRCWLTVRYPVADAFTDEDKRTFADPEYYKNFRRELESELNVRI